MNLTKNTEMMDMDVEVIEKRDTFYELHKNHLNELWDNATSKSLIYVSIVFLVYIVLMSLTILHETYQVNIRKDTFLNTYLLSLNSELWRRLEK